MEDIDKINRKVFYLHMQQYDSEAEPIGKNNTWIYKRALDGYKYLLHSVEVSARIGTSTTKAIFAMFDGHEHTDWLIFPGVECREGLTRSELTYQQPNFYAPLNLWECKEFTLAGRSLATAEAPKFQIIVWYYIKRMSRIETLYYAIAHPRFLRFRKAFRKTVEASEE